MSLLQPRGLGVLLRPYRSMAGCVGWRQLFPLPSLPQPAQSSTVGSGKVPCSSSMMEEPDGLQERGALSLGLGMDGGVSPGKRGARAVCRSGTGRALRDAGVLESREAQCLGWQHCRVGSLQALCYPRNRLGQSRQKSPGEKSVFPSLPPQLYCRADTNLPPCAAKSLRSIFPF